MLRDEALAYLSRLGVPVHSLDRDPIGNWVLRLDGAAGAKAYAGATIRDALAAAGHPMPKAGVFASRGSRVFGADGVTLVATAKSGTMAQRISNALNAYEPGPKGF